MWRVEREVSEVRRRASRGAVRPGSFVPNQGQQEREREGEGTHRRQSSQFRLKLAHEPRAPPFSKLLLARLLLGPLDLRPCADSRKPSVAGHKAVQDWSVGQVLEQREGGLPEGQVGGVECGGRGGARGVGSPS